MDFQTIIVGIIILAAVIYVGNIVLGKIKSFSSNNSCAGDCGCDIKSKSTNPFTQIKRR